MTNKNSKRIVISSTLKNEKIIAQQVVYKEQGVSITKHERIYEDDKGLLKILRKRSD